MEPENPIYIKFEKYEALQSKRDILFLEISLLNIMKTMRRYHLLREEELSKKKELIREIKALKTNLRRCNSFPLIKLPRRIRIKELEEKPTKPIKIFGDDLESQLKNIQEKLKSLGG
ncbi:MAG: hypothetical protein NTU63_02670 [Candidatus Pacearchaeota archaeon]|nr:hypothetical protein [Candidatus Pacearchaeota archaeon]